MLKKYLDKKGKVNFKIYDVRAWLTTIAIQILPNISQSKNNQAMKIDQVIEHNNKNSFLSKSFRK